MEIINYIQSLNYWDEEMRVERIYNINQILNDCSLSNYYYIDN